MSSEEIRADALLNNPVVVTEEERRRQEEEGRNATIVLAGHARDAAELADWLEMLGLLPYEAGSHGYQWGKAGEQP